MRTGKNGERSGPRTHPQDMWLCRGVWAGKKKASNENWSMVSGEGSEEKVGFQKTPRLNVQMECWWVAPDWLPESVLFMYGLAIVHLYSPSLSVFQENNPLSVVTGPVRPPAISHTCNSINNSGSQTVTSVTISPRWPGLD